VITREHVSIALYNLLVGSSTYQTTGRRFQTFANLPNVQKPALFLVEPKENHRRDKELVPARRIIEYECFIFIDDGTDPNAVPITVLNPLIDAIDPVNGGVLTPGINGRQTLGGIVMDCYIEGEIIKVPGDLDGQGAAIIPIKVIFMQP
jgi:hypothetical protein